MRLSNELRMPWFDNREMHLYHGRANSIGPYDNGLIKGHLQNRNVFNSLSFKLFTQRKSFTQKS